MGFLGVRIADGIAPVSRHASHVVVAYVLSWRAKCNCLLCLVLVWGGRGGRTTRHCNAAGVSSSLAQALARQR